jgi:hypothetical protein
MSFITAFSLLPAEQVSRVGGVGKVRDSRGDDVPTPARTYVLHSPVITVKMDKM